VASATTCDNPVASSDSVAVIIYVRAGADLVDESAVAANPIARDCLANAGEDGVDGGLDIRCGDQVLSWPDVWDRVDGMLASWIAALDAIADGADEAVAVFPDTRVECEIGRVGDIDVHIEYEDIAATVRRTDLHSALIGAAARLLDLVSDTPTKSPALQSLVARVAMETQG